MASTKGPASSSGLVMVTASNSHSPRLCKACRTESASTSSTSLPMSVSKMIFTGAGPAAEEERIAVKASSREARRRREGRNPKSEIRKKAEIRRPKSETTPHAGSEGLCLPGMFDCIEVGSVNYRGGKSKAKMRRRNAWGGEIDTGCTQWGGMASLTRLVGSAAGCYSRPLKRWMVSIMAR